MNKTRGIIYTIMSAIAYGLQPVLAKTAYLHGADTNMVLFYRYFLSLIMLMAIIKYKKITLRINFVQIKYLILLGTIGYALTASLLFLSYHYIGVGLATVLHFVYPVFVTIMMWGIYHESIDLKKGLALLSSGIGIYLLTIGSKVDLNIKGIGLALLSGVFYAVYIVGVNAQCMKKLNHYAINFYFSVVSTLFILLVGLCSDIHFKADSVSYVCCLCISVCSSVIAPVLLLCGIRIIGSTKAAILSTFEPIVGTFLGIMILHEVMSVSILIGSILILSAVVLVALSKQQEKIEQNS